MNVKWCVSKVPQYICFKNIKDSHVKRETEKVCCIISLPSYYNIVIIDSFDFNIFQMDLNFGNFGIFMRTHKDISIQLTIVHCNIELAK